MIDEGNDINNNSIRERKEILFLKNKIEELNTLQLKKKYYGKKRIQ